MFDVFQRAHEIYGTKLGSTPHTYVTQLNDFSREATFSWNHILRLRHRLRHWI